VGIEGVLVDSHGCVHTHRELKDIYEDSVIKELRKIDLQK
jgi:hypothetical protein